MHHSLSVEVCLARAVAAARSVASRVVISAEGSASGFSSGFSGSVGRYRWSGVGRELRGAGGAGWSCCGEDGTDFMTR